MQNYGNKCFMQNLFSKFGNLAYFHLGTWRIFTWELGVFSLGKLAQKTPLSLTSKSQQLLPVILVLLLPQCQLLFNVLD